MPSTSCSTTTSKPSICAIVSDVQNCTCIGTSSAAEIVMSRCVAVLPSPYREACTEASPRSRHRTVSVACALWSTPITEALAPHWATSQKVRPPGPQPTSTMHAACRSSWAARTCCKKGSTKAAITLRPPFNSGLLWEKK